MSVLPEGPAGSTAIVIIGRNEGERLRVCLESAIRCSDLVVYVDSDSTDGSVALAHALSVQVVELDMSLPFSAARARNAGVECVREEKPQTEFVQFLDGDCELDPEWIEMAISAMRAPDVAVVCGRRRERYPEVSVYNLLCDMEWATSIGEASACGGDSLMRLEAFCQVDGFRSEIVAGEEPDLCIRLRQQNWRILRIDAEMTLHDADMHQFSQWWRRTLRSGHAFAEGAHRHGAQAHPQYARGLKSGLFWGGMLPAVALVFAPWTHGLSLSLFGGWFILGVRVYRSNVKKDFSAAARRSYAASVVIGKTPVAMGVALFYWRRLLDRPARLIEYKDSTLR